MTLRTNISNEDYHSSEELSRSKASALLATSPAHVKHSIDNPVPSTPALLMGGCFHTAVLEPMKLEYEYGEKPTEIDGKGPLTNVYKQGMIELENSYPERRWLKSSDYNTCLEMASACLEHPVVSQYLAEADAIIEGTGYFNYEDAECKVRPDYFLPGADVVIDLKSTMDASPKGFAKSVRKFGYDFQACWYMEGLRRMGYSPKEFIFVAVEKSAPYATACYTLSASDIARHREPMRRACKIWAECVSSGVWPSYGDSVQTLELNNDFKRLSLQDLARKFNVGRHFVYKIVQSYQLETRTVGNKRTVDINDFAEALRWNAEEKAA